MKDITLLILFQIPTTACIVCATHLAYHGKDGWGWLLFIALCTSVSKFKST